MSLLKIEPNLLDSTANFVFGNTFATGYYYANGTPLSSGGSATPGGTDTQVQFNDSGSFSGNTNLTFNKTSGVLTATHLSGEGGNISNIAVANITGLGNIATINKDGNASNILYGNGVFAAAPAGGGGSGTYGDSNVAAYLPTYTGNLSPGNLIISTTNLKISGGNSGYVLSTDGAGNLSWAAQTGGNGGGEPSTLLSTVDTFTANGSTTNFTLTTTPASENFTFVNLDGVMQLKGSYSLVGNVIVLSGTPANGAVVEVTTLYASNISVPATPSTTTSKAIAMSILFGS